MLSINLSAACSNIQGAIITRWFTMILFIRAASLRPRGCRLRLRLPAEILPPLRTVLITQSLLRLLLVLLRGGRESPRNITRRARLNSTAVLCKRMTCSLFSCCLLHSKGNSLAMLYHKRLDVFGLSAVLYIRSV